MGKQKRRPQRFFKDMSVIQLDSFVRTNYGTVKSTLELKQVGGGCYEALHNRGILYAVFPEFKRSRKWSSFSDDELIDYVHQTYPSISRPVELGKLDRSCYDQILQRGLVSKLYPDKREARDWKSMNNKEFTGFINKNFNNMSLKEIENEDRGVYEQIRLRKLQSKISKEYKPRKNWSVLSDEDLISLTLSSYSSAKKPTELKKIDNSLYTILSKRKLLDKIYPDFVRHSWSKMSIEEILLFVRTNWPDLRNANQLQKVNGSCYNSLRRRGLLLLIFPKNEGFRSIDSLLESYILQGENK